MANRGQYWLLVQKRLRLAKDAQQWLLLTVVTGCQFVQDGQPWPSQILHGSEGALGIGTQDPTAWMAKNQRPSTTLFPQVHYSWHCSYSGIRLMASRNSTCFCFGILDPGFRYHNGAYARIVAAPWNEAACNYHRPKSCEQSPC